MKLNIRAVLSLITLLGSASCLQATNWLGELVSDFKLEIMRHGAAKSLYAVNLEFYRLAHHEKLEGVIQHVIRDGQAFDEDAFKVSPWFLPAVKLEFFPPELSRLEKVRMLDISALNIEENQVLALSSIQHISTFNFGDSNGDTFYSTANKILTDNRNVAIELYRILLKDPNYTGGYYASEFLMYNSILENDRNLCLTAWSQIMKNKTAPQQYNAAWKFCAYITPHERVTSSDASFAFNLLSEGVQEQQKEKSARSNWASWLLCSPNEAHHNLAYAFYGDAIQDESDSNRSSYALSLISSKNKHHQKLALIFLSNAAQNKTNPTRYADALNLLNCCNSNEGYTTIALNTLRDISQDKENPDRDQARYMLLKMGTDEDKRDIVAALLDPSQEKTAQATALQTIDLNDIKDPILRSQITQRAADLLNDESLDLCANTSLMQWVSREQISQETYLRLLSILDSEKEFSLTSFVVTEMFNTLLDCPYPDLQQKAEDLFLQDCFKFSSRYAGVSYCVLSQRVKKLSDDKMQLWIQKTATTLQSSELSAYKKFLLASYILHLTNDPQSVTPVQDVIRNLFDPKNMEQVDLVSHKFLNHLIDSDLKAKIASTLLVLAQGTDLTEADSDSDFFYRKKALVALLKQSDPSIQGEAYSLCKALASSMKRREQTPNTVDFFATVGLALTKIKSDKVLSQEIYNLLNPEWKTVLLNGQWSINEVYDALKFFLIMGDDQQKSDIYTLCCDAIDNAPYEEYAKNAVKIFTSTLGDKHPQSIELIERVEKSKNELQGPRSFRGD